MQRPADWPKRIRDMRYADQDDHGTADWGNEIGSLEGSNLVAPGSAVQMCVRVLGVFYCVHAPVSAQVVGGLVGSLSP